jgi:hypothetical protein
LGIFQDKQIRGNDAWRQLAAIICTPIRTRAMPFPYVKNVPLSPGWTRLKLPNCIILPKRTNERRRRVLTVLELHDPRLVAK